MNVRNRAMVVAVLVGVVLVGGRAVSKLGTAGHADGEGDDDNGGGCGGAMSGTSMESVGTLGSAMTTSDAGGVACPTTEPKDQSQCEGSGICNYHQQASAYCDGTIWHLAGRSAACPDTGLAFPATIGSAFPSGTDCRYFATGAESALTLVSKASDLATHVVEWYFNGTWHSNAYPMACPVVSAQGTVCSDAPLACTTRDRDAVCPGHAILSAWATAEHDGGPPTAAALQGVSCASSAPELQYLTLSDAGASVHTACSCANGTWACAPGPGVSDGGHPDAEAEIDAATAAEPATPLAIASDQAQPYGVAVDSTSVYWTDWMGQPPAGGDYAGTVMKTSLGGGKAITLAAKQNYPQSIAVDEASVYWTDLAFDGPGAVMKVPKGGGVPVTLAGGAPFALAVDATGVFWTDGSDGVREGRILKVSLEGGEVTTLASGTTRPQPIAVNGAAVFWIDAYALMKVPLDGGAVVTLVHGASVAGAAGIALDTANVYWPTASAVMKVPLGGGTPTTLATLVSNQSAPVGIAVDATSVYWGTLACYGSVMTVPIRGGTPITLAEKQCDPQSIVVDGTGIYWANQYSGGTLVRLAPR